jgi:hypothetical protein
MKLSAALSALALCSGTLAVPNPIAMPNLVNTTKHHLEAKENTYCQENPGASGQFWLEWKEYVQSTVTISRPSTRVNANRAGQRGNYTRVPEAVRQAHMSRYRSTLHCPQL